jgi:hypothetical protein
MYEAPGRIAFSEKMNILAKKTNPNNQRGTNSVFGYSILSVLHWIFPEKTLAQSICTNLCGSLRLLCALCGKKK